MEGKSLHAVLLPCSTTSRPFGNCRSSGDPHGNIHKCIVSMVVPTAFKSDHLFWGGQGWNCDRFDTEVLMCMAMASPCWWLALFGPLVGWEGSPTTCHSLQPLTVVAQLQNCSSSNKETLQSGSGNAILTTRVPLLPQTARFFWLWGTEQ